MTRWYGSLSNRLEENRMLVDQITVGTGVTEYSWSDRHPFEVVEVIDQKHVIVRALDHIMAGGEYENKWTLVSNESNPCRRLERRGDRWYWTSTLTAEDVDGLDREGILRVLMAGFDPEVIKTKGKQTKRVQARVSFGVADYYYDYSF